MKDQILALEREARKLEPETGKLNEWNELVMDYGVQFVQSIYQRNAYDSDYSPSKEIEEHDFQDSPKDLEDLLDLVYRAVDQTGINPASGGHLGYIPGGGVYPSALADYLVDITNRYAGIYYANPGAVRMENLLIKWMAEVVGFPVDCVGNLASGGSIANLMAVTAARDGKDIKSGDVKQSVIYLTEQTHHCIHKAVRIAGLAESPVRNVPLDQDFRMDTDALERYMDRDIKNGLNPFLVVASIGSTDTGAIDPVDAIGEICMKYDCWFHIDAAYGGFFALLREMKHYFKGVDKSDSIVIDPHKTLFLPYGLGAILVKDAKALSHSHYYRANYMQDVIQEDKQWSPADLSPELTKHFRGLRMWLPLQLMGLGPFKAAIKEKWLLCLYFYEKVQNLGFLVGPKPELSVCIYRYIPAKGDPNEFNMRLTEEIKTDGRIFISSTTIDGNYWIRIAIVCFRTHLDIVDEYLEILERTKTKLLTRGSL